MAINLQNKAETPLLWEINPFTRQPTDFKVFAHALKFLAENEEWIDENTEQAKVLLRQLAITHLDADSPFFARCRALYQKIFKSNQDLFPKESTFTFEITPTYKVKIPRSLLSWQSDVIAQMLKSSFLISETLKNENSSVEIGTIELMLNYLLRGKAKYWTFSTTLQLYLKADELQIPSLKGVCLGFLKTFSFEELKNNLEYLLQMTFRNGHPDRDLLFLLLTVGLLKKEFLPNSTWVRKLFANSQQIMDRVYDLEIPPGITFSYREGLRTADYLSEQHIGALEKIHALFPLQLISLDRDSKIKHDEILGVAKKFPNLKFIFDIKATDFTNYEGALDHVRQFRHRENDDPSLPYLYALHLGHIPLTDEQFNHILSLLPQVRGIATDSPLLCDLKLEHLTLQLFNCSSPSIRTLVASGSNINCFNCNHLTSISAQEAIEVCAQDCPQLAYLEAPKAKEINHILCHPEFQPEVPPSAKITHFCYAFARSVLRIQ